MSGKSIFTKAADVVHKVTLFGIFSFFGFTVYQLTSQVYKGEINSPYLQSTYRQDVDEKVKEAYEKDNEVSDRNARDWYAEDDDSYKKGEIRPNFTTPEFKKKYQENQKQ